MVVRSASATARNASTSPNWIVAATRSAEPIGRPRARRSASVRDSSCSTGR